MTTPPETDELKRRVFLKEAAIVATGLAIGVSLPAIAASRSPVVSDGAWRGMIAFLTGKNDLSVDVAARGYAALRAVEPDFEQRVLHLKQRLDAEGAKDVDEFRRSLADGSEVLATALAIISAFYLGHVGKSPDSRFVSYEQALMYRPTLDVTVVPTYSHGAPGYWTQAPKT